MLKSRAVGPRRVVFAGSVHGPGKPGKTVVAQAGQSHAEVFVSFRGHRVRMMRAFNLLGT